VSRAIHQRSHAIHHGSRHQPHIRGQDRYRRLTSRLRSLANLRTGGDALMDHPQALQALDLLIQALWSTHEFLVEGSPVGSRGDVLTAFREDRQVSFHPKGD